MQPSEVQNTSTNDWEHPSPRAIRVLLWLLMATVLSAVAWASVAQVRLDARAGGVLRPQQAQVQVRAPAGGTLLEVRVKPLERVKAGQTLFVLDALSAGGSGAFQLESKKAALEDAREALSVSQLDLETAQKLYAVNAELYSSGGIARVELERSRSDSQKATRTVQQRRLRLKALEADLRGATTQSRLEVKSPVAGLLTTLTGRSSGEVVGSGESLLEVLPEGSALVFSAALPQSERPKVKIGSRVLVSWSGLPHQKYGMTEGKVAQITPSSSVEGGQMVYGVEVALSSLTLNGERGEVRELLSGLSGEAHIITAEKTALELFWDWIRGVNPWSG